MKKSFWTVVRVMLLAFLMLPVVSCEKEEDVTLACPDEQHEHAVDLGLSVKWACCNVGAKSPEDFGGYYSWGETEEKTNYYWSTYKWCNYSNHDYELTKYNDKRTSSYFDGKVALNIEDDVAHVLQGSGWRMPTPQEFNELINCCQWKVVKHNGVECQMATGPNGNSILFPYGGYKKEEYSISDWDNRYWTSDLYYNGNGSEGSAYSVYFTNKPKKNSDDPSYPEVSFNTSPRCYGLSVRPVKSY